MSGATKDRVLFVRADTKLIRKLEALRTRMNKGRPGAPVSMACLVRTLLWKAIDQVAAEDSGGGVGRAS